MKTTKSARADRLGESMSRNSKPTFIQLVKSIVGAAIGVQNSQTRNRDFQQTGPAAYILGGVIFVVVFIAVLLLIAKSVIPEGL